MLVDKVLWRWLIKKITSNFYALWQENNLGKTDWMAKLNAANRLFTHLDALQNASLGKVDKKILRYPNQLPRNWTFRHFYNCHETNKVYVIINLANISTININWKYIILSMLNFKNLIHFGICLLRRNGQDIW